MPTSFTVGSESDLNAALAQIDLTGASSSPSTAYTITLSSSITLTSDLYAINLAQGDTLAIQGGGHTLDGGGTQRGLFAYAGSVTVSDLAIDDAQALGGGGYGGGGSGAGLGGGLFVASGALVTLDGVTFQGDSAVGGSRINEESDLGGGGGMGGNGGTGGGGGIGLSAMGDTGGPGIVLGAAPGGASSNGVQGGPGGGGGYSDGGGGVGGSNAGTASIGHGVRGASGGFGGGGGEGGDGGFGGGGGERGGNGGFGGGSSIGAAPGFGGNASYLTNPNGVIAGGDGLGAGGAIFVQQGGGLSLSSGTIGGGMAIGGHDSVSSGLGAGAGIFLQGDQQLVLSPSAGQTLSIGDVIADQTGSTHQTGLSADGDPLAGSGSLLVDGPGTVVLSVPNMSRLDEEYSGGTMLAGGTLELALAGRLGSAGDIVFAGPATLILDQTEAPSYHQPEDFNQIDGFAPGDAIDLRNLNSADNYRVVISPIDPYNVALLSQTNNQALPESLLIPDAHDLVLSAAADGSVVLGEAACYAAGTRIDTPSGEVAVEALRPGDRVSLVGGGSAPVRWVGHRRVDLRRHPRPDAVRPVRVRAHAFGPGLPRRDLVLSPEHALFLGGALVPIHVLVDGAQVVREWPDRVTYHHVELDRHGVILAEGLAAESYLDTGNRDCFANGAVCGLHPDFAAGAGDAEACAPMMLEGAPVEAARAALRESGRFGAIQVA